MTEKRRFFRYDNGKMCRQRGYYLYYERNDAMQEYMIEVNHNMPMEKKESVSDQAVKDFRKIISNQDKEEKKQLPYFMYASVAAAVLLILAFGTGYLKDYQTIKEAGENVLETVSLLPASESSLSATPTPSKTAEPMSSETPLPSEKEKTESVVTETPIPAAKKETTPIPSVTPTPLESPQMTETPAAAQTRTYTIRPGDTLTSISQSVYGNADQVNAICRLNNISKETIIYPGEKILLP